MPLQSVVNHEIKRMLDTNVISAIAEPTDWCAGTEVVLKKMAEYEKRKWAALEAHASHGR